MSQKYILIEINIHPAHNKTVLSGSLCVSENLKDEPNIKQTLTNTISSSNLFDLMKDYDDNNFMMDYIMQKIEEPLNIQYINSTQMNSFEDDDFVSYNTNNDDIKIKHRTFNYGVELENKRAEIIVMF